MKKLLSYFAIISLSTTIGNNVTSCFLFPKKESVYDNVVAKIKAKSKELTWTNDEFINGDGKVDLSTESDFKPGISELPPVWISMLTDLFGLEANDSPLKNEFHYITDIFSTDNILENGMQEDVKIVVAKYPTKPTSTSETITKKITWKDGKPPIIDLVNETYNEIDSKSNIYAFGANLIDDTSNDLTSNTIKNNIGLTKEQKDITTLYGTLVENNKVSIKFDIKNAKDEKTINKDVIWNKTSQDSAIKNKVINTSLYLGNNIILLGGKGGIYKSVDNGITFTNVYAFDNIYLLKKVNNIIYIGTNGAGLYYSTDELKTIIQRNDIPINSTIYTINYANNIIYIGASSKGLYKSTDNGKNFLKVNDIHSIYSFYGDLNRIYIGSYSGLYYSDNEGATLTEIGIYTNVSSIYKTKDGSFYIGTDKGIYKSEDDCKTFNEISNISTTYAIYQNDNGDIYAGTSSSGLYKSLNGTDDFIKIDSVPFKQIGSINNINNILYLNSKYNWGGTYSNSICYYALD